MGDRQSLLRGLRLIGTAVLLLVAATGCRLDVVADVELRSDGSGAVALEFHLDEALVEELDRLGVDPSAEVAAVVVDDPDWTLERTTAGEDGAGDGLVVTVRRDVADPDELGATLRELTAGLSSDDPALLLDLDVVLDDDGTGTVEGTGWLRPPATSGLLLDGEPVGAAGDELADLIERSVHATLVVTLPGEVVATDADRSDGRTALWQLPQDGERPLRAVAAGPSWLDANLPALLLAAAIVAFVVLLLIALLLRRRRAHRRARHATSWI